MIITRKDFAKFTGLGYGFVRDLFDRFNITEIDDYKYSNIRYDISWYDLQNIKMYLANKKDKRPRDYSEAIKKIDKLYED